MLLAAFFCASSIRTSRVLWTLTLAIKTRINLRLDSDRFRSKDIRQKSALTNNKQPKNRYMPFLL